MSTDGMKEDSDWPSELPPIEVRARYAEYLLSHGVELDITRGQDVEEKIFWPARLFYAGKLVGAALAGRLPSRTGYAWGALQAFANQNREQHEKLIPSERAWRATMVGMLEGDIAEDQDVSWEDPGLHSACIEELKDLAKRIKAGGGAAPA